MSEWADGLAAKGAAAARGGSTAAATTSSSSSSRTTAAGGSASKAGAGGLPENEVITEGSVKHVITYSYNDEGKVVKKTKTYRTERKMTSNNPRIQARREWVKFGDSQGLPDGPDEASTSIASDVFLELQIKKEVEDTADKGDDDVLASLQSVLQMGAQGKWTQRRQMEGAMGDQGAQAWAKFANQGGDAGGDGDAGPGAGGPTRYVSPAMRAGGGGESMQSRDEYPSIRVTNISENTTEDDLKELFRPFGGMQRCYLATDRDTGRSRGFAFISFYRREDAQRAIDKIDGHGYDHLILSVEWAKPSAKKEERKPFYQGSIS